MISTRILLATSTCVVALFTLAGCTTSSVPRDAATEDARVKACITNVSTRPVEYKFAPTTRTENDKQVSAGPASSGVLEPGKMQCGFSGMPNRGWAHLFVEVKSGFDSQFDTFMFSIAAGNETRALCAIRGEDGEFTSGGWLQNDVPLNMECGITWAYPVTALTNGATSTIGGKPTVTVNADVGM